MSMGSGSCERVSAMRRYWSSVVVVVAAQAVGIAWILQGARSNTASAVAWVYVLLPACLTIAYTTHVAFVSRTPVTQTDVSWCRFAGFILVFVTLYMALLEGLA